jgi:prepilin-type N-terminal cleavage/methylation domain-containing protein
MKSNKGFTLIELLIGITVSAMVFMLAGSIVSLLFRTDVKGQRSESFEQTKNDIVAEITNAVRWAEVVNVTTTDLGTITADGVEYTIQDGRLLKNNDPITGMSVIITKFKIRNRSEDPLLKSLDIQVEMESRQTATSHDTLNFVVSQRKTILNTQ